MDDKWQIKIKLAMEGERSEYTRDKVVDEKSPLLSEQGDSSNKVIMHEARPSPPHYIIVQKKTYGDVSSRR